MRFFTPVEMIKLEKLGPRMAKIFHFELKITPSIGQSFHECITPTGACHWGIDRPDYVILNEGTAINLMLGLGGANSSEQIK